MRRGRGVNAASSAHNEFVAGTTYSDIFNVASSDGTRTSVTINILGSNDAPVITTGATQSVAENTTFVAAYRTDADTVGTNPATFTITGGADQALFAITGGNLVFNAPRDFDTEPHSYQVEVTASDGANTTAADHHRRPDRRERQCAGDHHRRHPDGCREHDVSWRH